MARELLRYLGRHATNELITCCYNHLIPPAQQGTPHLPRSNSFPTLSEFASYGAVPAAVGLELRSTSTIAIGTDEHGCGTF